MKQQARSTIKSDTMEVVGKWWNVEEITIKELKTMLELIEKMGFTYELEYANKKGE